MAVASGAVASSVKETSSRLDSLPAASVATSLSVCSPSASAAPLISSKRCRFNEKLPFSCKSASTPTKLPTGISSNPARKLTISLTSAILPATDGSDVMSSASVPVSSLKAAVIAGGVSSLLTVTAVAVTLPAMSVAVTVRVCSPPARALTSSATSNAPPSSVTGI